MRIFLKHRSGRLGTSAFLLFVGVVTCFLSGPSWSQCTERNNESADWINESDDVRSEFGYSVASAGDVNGDGFADIIIGAYRYGQIETGRVWVYHGSALGLSSVPDWIVDGNQHQ